MRIVQSSDWRDRIPFETPTLAAEVAPGEPTRCFSCGPASEPLERTELWAVKHRHPTQHGGYVRFSCAAHRPAPAVAAPAAPTRAAASRPARRAPVERREAAPRRPAPSDVVRAMCPDCFVEVSATGTCGMCGRQVA
ncbi:glucose-6-phosphate dehydrogenase [Microbacterium sp. 10M-3C3]|uniref:glucose-6-phosphate dehydrogenase n=1 Tax=Microbacterium sp. 10M-3C3 TaxID=2483401 RepID=UPI000F638DE2|nr:glucose-6-phosphate dehydrogenase [Microbacterium sp. 10M-3C3]